MGKKDGDVPVHIQQMLKVLPLKLIFEVMSEQEKEKVSGKESNSEKTATKSTTSKTKKTTKKRSGFDIHDFVLKQKFNMC